MKLYTRQNEGLACFASVGASKPTSGQAQHRRNCGVAALAVDPRSPDFAEPRLGADKVAFRCKTGVVAQRSLSQEFAHRTNTVICDLLPWSWS